MFELDEAFVATSQAIGDLSLSHVRLQDDARYPWIVLIPRREAARELEDLSRQDLATLTDEILAAGQAVRALGARVDKLNVGALGNVTPSSTCMWSGAVSMIRPGPARSGAIAQRRPMTPGRWKPPSPRRARRSGSSPASG